MVQTLLRRETTDNIGRKGWNDRPYQLFLAIAISVTSKESSMA